MPQYFWLNKGQLTMFPPIVYKLGRKKEYFINYLFLMKEDVGKNRGKVKYIQTQRIANTQKTDKFELTRRLTISDKGKILLESD